MKKAPLKALANSLRELANVSKKGKEMYEFTPTTLHQSIQANWNMQPSDVHGVCSADTRYYQRQLFKLVKGRYDFTLPEKSDGQTGWKYNWFREILFGWGSVVVFYTRRYGWIPLPYSVLKFDEQYNPLIVQSSSTYGFDNPPKGIIGVNAALIQVSDDFYGFYDLVTHYAVMLASIDKGVDVNLMNTSLGLYMEAEDANDARDIKQAYSKATTGEPMVVTVRNRKRRGTPHEYKTMISQPKNAYLVNDFLVARRTIINQFLTDLGVANANTDKKERLITNEIEANNEEVGIVKDLVLDNMRRGAKQLKELSGIDIAPRLHKVSDGGMTQGPEREVSDNVQ